MTSVSADHIILTPIQPVERVSEEEMEVYNFQELSLDIQLVNLSPGEP